MFTVKHLLTQLLNIDLKCDDPAQLSNGGFVSNGSVVTYMCEEGFILVGNRQRFCNITTWTWNGSDPLCEGISCTINGLFTFNRIFPYSEL